MQKRLTVGLAAAGLFVLLTLAAKVTTAQAVFGTLLGTVQDKTGAVVPNATVILTNEGTNVENKTTTGPQGYYTFPDLNPGQYAVTVTATGFKKVVSEHNEVLVEQTTRVDLKLQPGAVSEQVTVTGQTPEVESTTSDLGYTVTEQQINTLPLSGRMFESLMQLAPGSMASAWGDFWENPAGGGSVAPGGAGGGMYVQVNGFPFEANLYLVDGVLDQELMNGFININIPFDEISELKMEISDPTAQYGTYGASVVNMTTKTGTNTFHGNLFEYNRNTDFNASDHFSRINPPFHSNQFGGEADGPIIKNRLFFSGDLQWLKEHTSTSGVWSLPTQPMRSGDLSAFDTTNSGITSGPITNPMACYYSAQANGLPNPQPCTASSAISLGSGTADTVPASDIVPIAAGFLQPTVTPLPNASGITNNYDYVQLTEESLPQFDARVDYVFSDKDRLFGRATYARRTFTQPAPGTVFMGQNDADTKSRQHNDVIGWDHTFTPTLINQARFGFNRYFIKDFVSAYGIEENNTLGVPNGNLSVFPDESGIAAMDWGGTWEGVGDPGSVPNGPGRMSNYYQLIDSVSLVKGRHNLMFGGDWVHIQAYCRNPQNDPRGQFKISGNYTGDGTSGAEISDWLVGALNQVWRDEFITKPQTRTNWVGGFGQDDYRITNKLTLNLGLRYDVYTKPVDVHNQQSNFVTSGPGAGMIQIASSNNRGPNVDTYKHDIAPRLGAAYSPDNGKTAIRAAFGISYWNDNFGATGGTLERDYPELLQETNTAPQQNCSTLVTPTAASGAPTGYVDSACGSYILANGLPGTGATAYGALAYPSNVAPGGFIASPPGFGVFEVAKNFRQDMAKSWNVSIERQLSSSMALHVAYVGNRGTHLYHDYQLNQCVPQTYGVAVTSLAQIEAQEGVPGNAAEACYLAGIGFPYNDVAPNISTLDFRNSGGSSRFDAGEAEVIKRMSHGLAFTVSYTWSKMMDNISNPIDNYATRQEEDTGNGWMHPFFPQVLTATYSYELPFGRGKHFGSSISPMADTIMGGWEISGITNFRSGGPLIIGAPNGDLGPNGASQRANYNCASQYNPHKVNDWFETDCFSAPQGFTLGDSGVGRVYGPRYQDWDMSIAKSVHIWERAQLQFQAQFFNVFNHVNYQSPDTGVKDSNFGVINNDLLMRQGQLGMTLSF